MTITVTATGNEGFHVTAPGVALFIDAFWDIPVRFLGGRRRPLATELPTDLILVTHSHWDHFSRSGVAEAADRTGADVVGPEDVVRRLRGELPDGRLMALEPPQSPRGSPAASATVQRRGAEVTAFRTWHGQAHNSYLVRAGGFTLLHDGDNEDTRMLDPAALGPVDALLLCPWQGSGWAAFVEELTPRKWVLMHLSDEEIDEHRAGRFLPELCDRVPLPDRAVALRPGESLTLN